MRLTNNKRACVPADWTANDVPTYLRGMALRRWRALTMSALGRRGRLPGQMRSRHVLNCTRPRTGPSRSGAAGRACLLSLLVLGGRAPYMAVWVPGIDESGTAGAEQSFHVLDCFVDNAARPPGL